MNFNELRQRKDKGPYDNSLELLTNIYDKMPYVRDSAFCNLENVIYNNNRIVKFYRCNLTVNSYNIPPIPAEIN